ncbi:MAG: hypothetical protein AABY88_08765 [Pseudomonadota bacterium]
MNNEMEDIFDVELRKQFKEPVPDDGFCDRVMEQLPARPRRNKWPLATGALAGMATCWFSLVFSPITYVGWRDWLSGELSASAIVLFISMMSMAILALAWTIAEADDRYDPSSRRMIR